MAQVEIADVTSWSFGHVLCHADVECSPILLAIGILQKFDGVSPTALRMALGFNGILGQSSERDADLHAPVMFDTLFAENATLSHNCVSQPPLLAAIGLLLCGVLV